MQRKEFNFFKHFVENQDFNSNDDSADGKSSKPNDQFKFNRKVAQKDAKFQKFVENHNRHLVTNLSVLKRSINPVRFSVIKESIRKSFNQSHGGVMSK